ncbi:hypothetical protein AN944_02569 [Shewanella sp. P1-14-1]|nr:hypothetical protein AN944_02569 [Shewanella sp. P1-14-1]
MPSLFNVTPFEPIQPMLIKFVTKKPATSAGFFLKSYQLIWQASLLSEDPFVGMEFQYSLHQVHF